MPKNRPMIDYEARVKEIYLRHLRRGDTAVDVGAHLGYHTFAMLPWVGRQGYVLAFEPLKPLADALARGIEKLDRHWRRAVDLHCAALGNQSGSASFVHVPDAPYFSGFERREYDKPRDTQTITVEVKMLDEFIESLPSMEYLKIDTEGSELLVLRGAEHCVRKFRPLISIEYGKASADAYNMTSDDMFNFLAGVDYRLFDIMGREMEPDTFRDSSTRQDLWDYLAIPKERPDIAEKIFV